MQAPLETVHDLAVRVTGGWTATPDRNPG